MKKIVFLAFVLWLLSMSMFCTRLVVKVNGLTYDVFPGDSIQEAINLAESGDIIRVHAGTYLESLDVNKPVSLIGDDKHNTIIYWNDTGNVVRVTADNTVITNFALTLASEESAYPNSGIFLDDSDGNNISNNIISGNGTTNNDRGIYLYRSSNNIISGNNITNNGNGIYLYRSSGNFIYHNSFINNAKHVDDAGLGHNPTPLSVNSWDNDYPSGGNYWDDYLTRYPNVKEIDGSGIGDTPYVIYEKNQDNYPLLPPWFPPTVSIISPENKTYNVNHVDLTFTVSEAADWRGYSLDGQANVTITGNTTLLGLLDGSHNVVVYANDTAGNMGESSTVYFTVDIVAPHIEIISPENKTYNVNHVDLTFTVSEPTPWIGYSLDGQANVKITGNTTLSGLSDGVHTITVYAADTAGNMGSSETVYFTIDTVAPKIVLLSPENKTYNVNHVDLTFTVSETTSWEGYSLDGQANKTIPVDRTLRELSDGMHSIVVYATDVAGNTGHSDTVYFTVDTTLPGITILSPENKTYDTTAVLLSFTVDKAVLWMGYSLDGQANVTITGDTTLASLVDGVHYVVVYANNTAGKVGASNTVYFTVDTETPIIIILSPRNETYASASFSLNFTQSEPTSWLGYSLDGQMNVTVGGNTTLVGLSEGIHSIIVYANDTAGNMGSSGTVYFTIDATVPSITILSPENKTYDTNFVPLSFTVSETTSWIGYSLDGQANVTITENVTLPLPDGLHYVVVYANDTAGNMGESSTVYFTVDSVVPSILLVSPKNTTYASASVPLRFLTYETASWMGYSLDGLMNVTVYGNTTLVGLSDGVHTITVYANDTAGNMGRSVTVYFTINALPPNIEITSPENKTYTTNSVSLRFSVNEPTLWKGYSLDGQANVTIFGDITLSGLSEGSHSLVVYVKDMVGNTGASGIVYFAVETRQTEPSQLWIVAVIVIIAGVGFALSGYMAYDLFKRAPK